MPFRLPPLPCLLHVIRNVVLGSTPFVPVRFFNGDFGEAQKEDQKHLLRETENTMKFGLFSMVQVRRRAFIGSLFGRHTSRRDSVSAAVAPMT